MRYPLHTLLPASLLLCLGFPAQSNASIINNINGYDYEWLELSQTLNLSRVSVESLLSDPTSSYYGFRYATRVETQALLESYMPYVPAELNHWEAYLAPSAQAFFDDFGITHMENFGMTYQTVTNDGVVIDYNKYLHAYFYYGAASECGLDNSCIGRMLAATIDGNILAQFTPSLRGFDASWPEPDTFSVYESSTIAGSLLVREILPVPLPAAVWLFANGFIMLIGLMRINHKKNANSDRPRN